MKDIVLRLVMSSSPASTDMYIYMLSLSQRMKEDRERELGSVFFSSVRGSRNEEKNDDVPVNTLNM